MPSDAIEQDTVPPAPTAGVVHDQPPGADNETNVVAAGKGSEIDTAAAALGPAVTTVIVYTTAPPGNTGSAASSFVTDRSALVPTVVVSVAERSPESGSAVVDV